MASTVKNGNDRLRKGNRRRRPVCPKKLRSAPLLDCRNQLFTPSKCTKKHAFTIVERHKIVRNRNTVFRTSHTLCRFTRSSNDRVTKQATRCSKCQRSTEQQQSIKCFKIHSKDLLQNNDFHITSSIFLLSSVLVFYFFLILFFNSIVYRFFIARIFGVLPEYFRDWGGCRPPRPPGSYAYATFSTNEKQNQTPNQSWLACTHFPALGTGYMYLFESWLAHCAIRVWCDWSV